MQFKGVLFYESFLCRRKLLGERKEIRKTASLSSCHKLLEPAEHMYENCEQFKNVNCFLAKKTPGENYLKAVQNIHSRYWLIKGPSKILVNPSRQLLFIFWQHFVYSKNERYTLL